MYELIKELFEAHEYESQDINEGDILFSLSANSGKKDFWLLIQENNLDSLINSQIELFEQCKQVNKASELEKNISMLVLWDTGGEQEFNVMKKQIMPIEEDPYFFKKHVLYFSTNELTAFNEASNEENVVDFINEKIPLQDTFSTFKERPQAQSWQVLLYRLAIKLPFIKVDIDETGDLGSLYTQNNNKIEEHTDASLQVLNGKIFELYEELSLYDLNNKGVSELLADLIPSLSEENENEY